MSSNISDPRRDCLDRAADCRRHSQETSDTEARRDFLDLERRWMRLARSYEFVDRLDSFLDESPSSRKVSR